MKKNNKKFEKLKERMTIEEVAQKVEMLFQFIATLVPHKDLIKKIWKDSEGRASTAVSAAVLISTNYQQLEAQHKMYARRAELIYQMIDELENGNKEVKKIKNNEDQRFKIAKHLGLM